MPESMLHFWHTTFTNTTKTIQLLKLTRSIFKDLLSEMDALTGHMTVNQQLII